MTSTLLWWLQASNILGVQSKPFSPDTHVFEPDEYEDPVRLRSHHSLCMLTGPEWRCVLLRCTSCC